MILNVIFKIPIIHNTNLKYENCIIHTKKGQYCSQARKAAVNRLNFITKWPPLHASCAEPVSTCGLTNPSLSYGTNSLCECVVSGLLPHINMSKL